MNRARRSPSSSAARAAAGLLAVLLAAAWTASLLVLVRIHRMEEAGDGDGPTGPSRARKSSRRRGAAADADDDNPSGDVHVVFSTDCSGYQHWQSIASHYALRRAGHRGPVTRIASGCTAKQEEEVREDLRGTGLNLHVTPSFALAGSGNGRYKYSNKPGGLHHWMRHRNGTTLDDASSVVALVDPDMMALRPILPTLGEGTTSVPVTRDGYRDLEERVDGRGRALLLRRRGLPDLPPRVTRGVAAGQHFGLGGFWASAGTKRARPDFREFNLTKVCGAGSPCLNVPPPPGDGSSDRAAYYTTRAYADANYAVGPVYVASAEDWRDLLLPRWDDFTPRVHAQYPKLLAEMYAFAMAAADARLKFALSSSYMVSDPHTMSTTEAWYWVDDYATTTAGGVARRPSGEVDHPEGRPDPPADDDPRRVCAGATSTSLPAETLRRLRRYGYGEYGERGAGFGGDDGIDGGGGGFRGSGGLPTVLHYCQNYEMAGHRFAKRRVPHDFFRCDGEPLAFDVDALLDRLDAMKRDEGMSETKRKKETRTAFMLCHLIPLMNAALAEYKADRGCNG